jgi:hypothetical protein
MASVRSEPCRARVPHATVPSPSTAASRYVNITGAAVPCARRGTRSTRSARYGRSKTASGRCDECLPSFERGDNRRPIGVYTSQQFGATGIASSDPHD